MWPVVLHALKFQKLQQSAPFCNENLIFREWTQISSKPIPIGRGHPSPDPRLFGVPL